MATTARVRVSTAARASPASAGARASRRRAVAAARGRGGRRLARASTASSSSETTTDATYVESEEEEAERVAVGALVGWCVERGATGSGLSVLLPDGSGRGRGLEASRDIEASEPVLCLPLEMGICDYQDGHPPSAWETMSNAPWGVRLACRLLQERAKGADSEWAPYLALVPESVPGSPLLYAEEDVKALQYPPAVTEATEMRDAVSSWHARLSNECADALAGADLDAFKAAVSVVHSRTYGIASGDGSGEGYFRALLPLADLLNHGGDEYDDSSVAAVDSTIDGTPTVAAAVPSKWPPSRCVDNIAWSELGDDGFVSFSATRDVVAGEEALMSYGERSNDHFLMYYGFVPPRNPHDDVIVFADVDHALSWHMVYHPEMWEGGGDDEAAVRERAARAAVASVEKSLGDGGDGALARSEPRLKVLPGGRCDARLISLFAAAYAGTEGAQDAGSGGQLARVDVDSAHADVARRCEELLRAMPTTIAEDDDLLSAAAESAPGGGDGGGVADATRSAIAYRRHKKVVLDDAIECLGGGGGEA